MEKKLNSSRGALIVLEGLDRSGKTSQSGRLLNYLDGLGYPSESFRFPDRNTGTGQMISSYLTNKSQLDDHAIHLLFSANRWEKRSFMETKLQSGISLIVDRYSYSGVAFSSAKGLDLDWCKAPDVGLLAPDLVLYLDISPEELIDLSLQRVQLLAEVTCSWQDNEAFGNTRFSVKPQKEEAMVVRDTSSLSFKGKLRNPTRFFKIPRGRL